MQERIFGGHFNEPDTYVTRRLKGMEDWLIVFTLDGEGYFRTAAGEKRCGAGDIGLLRSGVPHQYGTSPGHRWHFVWAHFPTLPEIGFLPEEEVFIHHVASTHNRKRIYRAFRKLLQDSRERTGLWQALCENSLKEVLLLIAAGQTNMDPRIEQAMHQLTQQMREQVRIDDIAKKVGLSPSRLSHLFKEETGETILEALNRMRINQAALLIGNPGGRTPTEAALDVGFQNYNHFAAQFKKYMGSSPRDFRRGH